MRPTVHRRVAVSVARRGDVRPTVHRRVAVSVARGRETNCSYTGSGIRGEGT